MVDWNTEQGWAAARGRVLIAPDDADDFVSALAQLGPDDVAIHCAGGTVAECLRCAMAIREFIRSRLERGRCVFIAND